MKEYLAHEFSSEDKDLVSVIDELPLWSAPFGLSILNTIKMAKSLKVLDIGSGLGFPAIEIAQRLGDSSFVYGVDPWKQANERANLKILKYGLKNIKIIEGMAEKLPFENSYFNLIVSNNGINNVENVQTTFSECRRVSKPGAQFVFTMNLDGSMIEFYNIFKDELKKRNLFEAVKKMKEHIYHKRKPVNEMKELVSSYSFKIREIKEDIFYIRFVDAVSMFNHSFIKYWFLPSWKEVVEEKYHEQVFNSIEKRMNEASEIENEIKLSIPFATFDCERI